MGLTDAVHTNRAYKSFCAGFVNVASGPHGPSWVCLATLTVSLSISLLSLPLSLSPSLYLPLPLPLSLPLSLSLSECIYVDLQVDFL